MVTGLVTKSSWPGLPGAGMVRQQGKVRSWVVILDRDRLAADVDRARRKSSIR
jgi:hypothetical protein